MAFQLLGSKSQPTSQTSNKKFKLLGVSQKPSQNVGASPVSAKPQVNVKSIIDKMPNNVVESAANRIMGDDFVQQRNALFEAGQNSVPPTISQIDVGSIIANKPRQTNNVPQDVINSIPSNLPKKRIVSPVRQPDYFETNYGQLAGKAMVAADSLRSVVAQNAVDISRGDFNPLRSTEKAFTDAAQGIPGPSITDALPEGYRNWRDKHPILSAPVEFVSNALADPINYLPTGLAGDELFESASKNALKKKATKELTNIIDAVDSGTNVALQGAGLALNKGGQYIGNKINKAVDNAFGDDLFKGLGDYAAEAPTKQDIAYMRSTKVQPTVNTPDVIEAGPFLALPEGKPNVNALVKPASLQGSYKVKPRFTGEYNIIETPAEIKPATLPGKYTTVPKYTGEMRIVEKERGKPFSKSETIKGLEPIAIYPDLPSKSNINKSMLFKNSKIEPVYETPKLPSKSNIDKSKLFNIENPYQMTESQIAQSQRKLFGKELPYTNIRNTLEGKLPKIKQVDNLDSKLPKIKASNNLMQESGFKTGTLAKTPELADVQDVIKQSEMMYEVKPNAQTVAKAQQALDTDFYGNMKRIMNGKESFTSAEDTAMVGLITKGLAKNAQQTGDYTLLTEFIQKTRPKVTNTAQALQALKTWQLDSPENVVMYAQKLLDTANNEMAEKIGKKYVGAKLTSDDVKYILNKADEIFSMPQGRAKELAIGQLRQYIGDKLPVSNKDKFVSLMKMNMLSSPTTGLRNFVGNTLFSVAENIKQPISGLVDAGISKITGKRTTTILPDIGAQLKGIGQGAYRQIDDLIKGIDTSRSSTAVADMLGEKLGNTFKNPLLKAYENYTKFLVRDDMFWQAAYNQRVSELMKLNKVKELTKEMLEDAVQYADERVLQNMSKSAEFATGIRRDLNKYIGDIGGDVILPFAKTPANITSKTTDYFPVTSIFKIGSELNKAKKGMFDQKRFVDLVGRFGVGTAITAFGAYLGKKGYITLEPSKSKAANEFNKEVGIQSYALKIGDKRIDISNYAPISALLLAGASIAKSIKDKDKTLDLIFEGSGAGFDSIANSSYLQGISDYFRTAGTSGHFQAIKDTIADIPNMLMPNILKRTNLAVDPFARESDNKVLANTIGLSKTLPKKVTGFGEDMPRTQKPMNIVEALFNPFIVTQETKDPVKQELRRLFESMNETEILPAADNYFEKIQSYPLTTDEKLQFKKFYGQMLMQEYKNILNSADYKNASDDIKIKMLKKIEDKVREEAKKKILEQKGIK